MSTLAAPTALPWRLPAPPGLVDGATSLQGASRGSAVDGTDDDSPVFAFQRRFLKLNWRELLSIDLGRVITTVDLGLLHSQLESLTFADLSEADLAYFTDANFVHVFRLCQLVLEYQLFAWQAATVAGNLRTQKYAQLKEHTAKLKQKLAHEQKENKTLKKELKYCKQVIAALEQEKHGLVAGQTMLGGSVGRFPHPPLQPLHPRPDAATAPAPVPAPASPSAADLHAHYAAQFEAFQTSMAKQVREAAEQADQQRNNKIDALQQQLQLLLQAQQDELQKQQQQRSGQEQQTAQSTMQSVSTSQEEAKTDEALSATAAGPSVPLATPARQAQQQLVASMMTELAQLRQSSSSGTPGADNVVIGAFNSTAMDGTSADASAQQRQSDQTLRSSSIYKFDRAPSTWLLHSPAASAGSSAPVHGSEPAPVVDTRPGVRASARTRPVFTAEQQAEVDALSSWLRAVEAEELGAEILKMQQEAALIARAEETKRLQAQREHDEAQVRAVEEHMPPDHPLLVGTILASPGARVQTTTARAASTATQQWPAGQTAGSPVAATAGSVSSPPPSQPVAASPSPIASASTLLSPQPTAASVASPAASAAALISPTVPRSSSPSLGLTIEIASPASMPLVRPLLVGNSLIAPPTTTSTSASATVTAASTASNDDAITTVADPLASPRVAQNVSASARQPVLPPAPLIEPLEVKSLEEHAEELAQMSPSSRSRALEHAKSMIKLRSVIQARSSVPEALYAPFPSMPFLPSLYNLAPEELRDCYDVCYTWMDTSMRTEGNAQELLRYAVQMDPSGEIYGEVEQRINALTQAHFDINKNEGHQAALQHLAELEESNAHHALEENARRIEQARWQEERVSAFEEEWVRLQNSEEERAFYEAQLEAERHSLREQEFVDYLQHLERRQAEMEAMARAAERAHQARQNPYDRIPVSGTALIPAHHASHMARARSQQQQQRGALSPRGGGSASPQRAAGHFGQPNAGVAQQQAHQRSPHRTQRALRRSAAGSISEDEDEEDDDEDDEFENQQPRNYQQQQQQHYQYQPSNLQQAQRASTKPRAVRPVVPYQQQHQQPQQPQSQTGARQPSSPGQRPIPPASARSTYSPHSPPPAKLPPPLVPPPAVLEQQKQRDSNDVEELKQSPSSPARRGRELGLSSRRRGGILVDEDEDELLEEERAHRNAPNTNPATDAASSSLVSSFEPSAAAQFSRPGGAKRAQNTAAANTRQASQAQPQEYASAKPGTPAASIPSASALSRPRTAVGSTRTRFATGGLGDSFDDDGEEDTDVGQLGAHPAQQQAQPVPQPDEAKRPDTAAAMHPRDAARVLNPRRAAGGNLGGLLSGGMGGFMGPGGGGLVAAGRPATSTRPMSAAMAMATGQDSDGDVSDVSSVVHLSESEGGNKQQQQGAVPSASPLLGPSSGPVIQGRGRPHSSSQVGGRPLGGSVAAPPPPRGGEDSLSSLLGGGLGGGLGMGMKRPAGRGLSAGPGNYRSRLMQASNLNESEGDSSLDLNE